MDCSAGLKQLLLFAPLYVDGLFSFFNVFNILHLQRPYASGNEVAVHSG